MEFSNIFGLIIRAITYHMPELVFNQKLQDLLNTVVNSITRSGSVYWTLSFGVELWKLPLLELNYLIEQTKFFCEENDE